MSFENWTIEELIARCTDFDEMTLEMDREEFAALRRKITELKQAGNSPVIVGIDMSSGQDHSVEVRCYSGLRDGAEGAYRAHGN